MLKQREKRLLRVAQLRGNMTNRFEPSLRTFQIGPIDQKDHESRKIAAPRKTLKLRKTQPKNRFAISGPRFAAYLTALLVAYVLRIMKDEEYAHRSKNFWAIAQKTIAVTIRDVLRYYAIYIGTSSHS